MNTIQSVSHNSGAVFLNSGDNVNNISNNQININIILAVNEYTDGLQSLIDIVTDEIRNKLGGVGDVAQKTINLTANKRPERNHKQSLIRKSNI